MQQCSDVDRGREGRGLTGQQNRLTPLPSSHAPPPVFGAVMVCAERNLTLGPGDACISPAVTCPRIPDHPNMSVVLSPEGLAYERLPGTMAEYSCYNGHVDRVGTRSYCTALGTWSSSPPANCSLCSEHLPHCVRRPL